VSPNRRGAVAACSTSVKSKPKRSPALQSIVTAQTPFLDTALHHKCSEDIGYWPDCAVVVPAMQMSSARCGMRAGGRLNQRPLVPSWHVPVPRTHIQFGTMPQLVCCTLVRNRSAPVVTAAGRRLVYHNTLLPEPSLMMPASPLSHDNAHSSVISHQHLMPARWQMHMLFTLLADRRITAMQRHIVCPRLCTRSTCECEAREQQFGGRCEDVDLGFFYILMGASSPSFTLSALWPLPCGCQSIYPGYLLLFVGAIHIGPSQVHSNADVECL
jgi:hypothetical protein